MEALIKPLLFLILIIHSNGGPIDQLSISGGQNTPIRNHPFQASITVDGTFVCSGSLIHSNWVLTVASCIQGYEPSFIKVRFGTDKTDEGGSEIAVKQVKVHEKFSSRSMDYDIALLELVSSAKANPSVKTIRLAHDPVIAGQSMTLTGWGQDENENEGKYQKLVIKIQNLEYCKDMLINEIVTSRMICARADDLKDGPCWGDFGDPLVNPWKALVGIYSFTRECGRYPSVFTDVVGMRPWIESAMKDSGHQLE